MRGLKLCWACALLLLCGAALTAADSKATAKKAAPAAKVTVTAAPKAEEPKELNYECVMITIWNGAPDVQATSATYGAKVGILGSFGKPVYGAELAVVTASSEEVWGVKGSLGYLNGKKCCGFALTPVNVVDEMDGLSIAAVNVAKKAGFQIGILNFNKTGFLPVFPLINFSL